MHTTALIIKSWSTRCTYATTHTHTTGIPRLDNPVVEKSMYVHYPTDTTGIPRLDNAVVEHSMYIHYPTDTTCIPQP